MPGSVCLLAEFIGDFQPRLGRRQARGEQCSLDIDIDTSTGVPTLFINQRIQSAGKTLGVGGIGLGVSAMSDLIRNTRFGKAGLVYLVSADAQVKIHPQAQLSNNSDLMQLVARAAAQQLLRNDGKVQHFERQGAAYLAMAMPLKTLGWQLVAEVPEAEIYAEARAALTITALISLLVALACLGLVLVLARGQVRPLRRVTAALVEIGSGGGDLSRRLDESRAYELGDLAHPSADEAHSGRQGWQTLRQLAEDLTRQMGSFRL